MKLYNGKWIIPGLLVFLIIFLFPFWYRGGKAAPAPKLELPKDQSACVETTKYMRAFHMQMLNQWRDLAVRDSLRVWKAADGRTHTISLSNTCFACHKSKVKFCDRCHNYVGVAPYCWDCHLVPKEAK